MHPLTTPYPVSFSDIDFEDRSYCLTPWDEPPDETLLSSIKQFGILHTPILIQNKNGLFCIVTGRKRIAGAQQYFPERSVSCHVLPNDTETNQSFLFLLEEKTSKGTLSVTEQIFFFDKFLRVASREESIPLLEKCGLKPQEHVLNDLLTLKSLDISVLKAVHLEKIPKKNAGKLLKLSKIDQQLLVQIISELQLGGSKQQKLIEFCTELIKRKKMELVKILEEYPWQEGRKQPGNMPQHAAALLKWLHQECFPQSSEAEKIFQYKVARLQLPPSIQITHTPAFENEEITLSVRLPDWDALNKVLQNIQTIISAK